MQDKSVDITLTRAEALVLEAFLSHIEEQADFQQLDLAARLVLYKLHAALEQVLEDLFDPNYQQLLLQAQSEVCNTETGPA
jgi:hypothetical protein